MRLVHYNSREEMIAAYRKAKQRKREWMEEQERDFQRIKESLKAKPMKQNIIPNDELMCFYAHQVDGAMDKLWAEGKWNEEKNEAVLKEHLRTPYPSASHSIDEVRATIQRAMEHKDNPNYWTTTEEMEARLHKKYPEWN